MKKFKYLLIIVLFLFVSFIYYMPHIFIKENIERDQNLSNNFSYSPFATTADVPGEQLHYVGNIVKFSKGAFTNKRFKIFENQNKFTPSYFPIQNIIGFIGTIIFGSIENFLIKKDFLLPLLILFTSFVFLKKLKYRTFPSFFGSILLTSGATFYTIYNLLIFDLDPYILQNTIDHISYITERWPHQLVTLYSLIFYIFVITCLNNSSVKIHIILGIIGGLSFYIYFYSYLVFSLQLFFIFIFLSILRKKIDKNFLLSGILFLLIGSPYIINSTFYFLYSDDIIFQNLAGGFNKFKLEDVGKTYFEISLIFFLFLFLLIFLSYTNKKYFNNSVFIISIGLPLYLIAIVSSKINLIPEPTHMFAYIEWPFFQLLTLITLGNYCYENRKTIIVNKKFINNFISSNKVLYLSKSLKFLTVIIMTYYLANWTFTSIIFQLKKSNEKYEEYILSNNEIEAYEWINNNTKQNHTILTLDPKQHRLIHAYTGLYGYTAPNTQEPIKISNSMKRFKESFSFYGILGKDARKLFSKSQHEKTNFNFKLKYHQKNFNQNYINFNYFTFSNTFNYQNINSYDYFYHFFTEEEKDKISFMLDGRKGFDPDKINYFMPEKFIDNYFGINYKINLGDTNIFTKKIDYIWFGKFEQTLSKRQKIINSNIKKVFENNDITIYKINN